MRRIFIIDKRPCLPKGSVFFIMKFMKKKTFFEGVKDGLPIGLGYFAVAFSIGIVAKTASLSPIQGFVASFLNVASAGEYALFTALRTLRLP